MRGVATGSRLSTKEPAMLTIFGRKQRFCDGVSRRQFLQAGAAGIGGLTLADLYRADARAASGARRRSIITIHLPGGPSHMDMFDIKTEAPAEFRGEFSAIDTNVPGIQICEHFPRLASIMDRLVAVRTVSNMANEHSSWQTNTGWTESSLRSIGGRPSVGSVIARLQGATHRAAPPFVELSGDAKAGFLGPVYQPYRPDGPGRSNLTLSGGMTRDRLGNRAELLGGLDRLRRQVDSSGMMEAMDSFNQRAVGVITSSVMADAFDVTKEDPRVRERYADPARRMHGTDNFLIARRLLEAGVRAVNFWYGSWDTHGNNFGHLKSQLPELDIGLSALVEDLHDRGMLDDTLILMMGEFGRTPRVNGGAGRDHWPQLGCALLAGGGMRAGQAIGTTNRLGEFAKDRPVDLHEVFATLYHQLAVDPERTTLIDPNGRPQYLVDVRQPMPELV
jgi:hypothetical protein